MKIGGSDAFQFKNRKRLLGNKNGMKETEWQKTVKQQLEKYYIPLGGEAPKPNKEKPSESKERPNKDKNPPNFKHDF